MNDRYATSPTTRRTPNPHDVAKAVLRPAIVRESADWLQQMHGKEHAGEPGFAAAVDLRPLAEATMARIRAGLAAYPADPTLLTVNHSGHDGRAVPADAAPLSSRTAKIGDGVLVPAGAFYVKNYSGRPQDRVRDVGDPISTVTTKRSHSLVVPPQDGSFVVTLRRNGTATTVGEPVSTVSAGGNHHGLVVPYRRGSAKPASDPMLTLGTRDSAGLLRPAVDVEDCHFRMVQPREQLHAQRFPSDYVVHGNKGEQTMQAGNAVSVNAAAWIGRRVDAVF